IRDHLRTSAFQSHYLVACQKRRTADAKTSAVRLVRLDRRRVEAPSSRRLASSPGPPLPQTARGFRAKDANDEKDREAAQRDRHGLPEQPHEKPDGDPEKAEDESERDQSQYGDQSD